MAGLFSVNKWCFALGPPRVGVWDRFTSTGVKVKDGTESVFNEANLGQMVDNFADRSNDLAMCYDHQSAYVAQNGQPAPALAFYNALALVWDGKIVKFAAHSPDVTPPDPTGLEDGVYGFRSEVTDLGEKLLPNFKFLSPMFTDQGADEEGNDIGYDLMDVAATNTPFQDGVGLTFHKGSAVVRTPPTRKETFTMDPEMMKRLGLADDASADEVKGAMTAHLAKYFAAEDEAKKMADEAASDAKEDEDKDKKDDEKPAPEKMADEASDGEKKQMDDSDDDDDMMAMAKSLGLKGASTQAIRYAVEAKLVQAREAVVMRSELEKLRAEAQAVREQTLSLEADRFADAAITEGQWPEEKRGDLTKLYARSADDAKAVLFKKGEFTLVRKTFAKSLDPKGVKTDIEQKAAHQNVGGEFAIKAQAYSKEHKVPLAKAQIEVARLHPELYNAYKLGE